MVTQICTWYVITTKENLAIKDQFLAVWSDTPEAHVTTFARQLDMRQVDCKDNEVTVTCDEKVRLWLVQGQILGRLGGDRR